jgi:O-antigen biosynthesis protein
MQGKKKVSIIIAVYNQLPYTKMAVDSILANTDPSLFEFIMVDNGSRPEMKAYFDSLKGRADVTYIRNESNAGPIRAINQGIKASGADYIMAIHNDVIIMEKGWLDKIISVMDKDPSIGIAGLAGRKEIYDTGSVNEESLKHNLQNEDLNAPMKEDVAQVAVLDGLCFVLRRELIEKIGGLDETYGYMHCYDLDVSLAGIAAGYKNVVVNVSALHIGNGGMTRKLRDYKDLVKDDYGLLKRNCKILVKKWKRLLPLKIY